MSETMKLRNQEVGGSIPPRSTNLQGFGRIWGHGGVWHRIAAGVLTLALALLWAPASEAQIVITGSPSRQDATGAYTVSLDLEHLMPVPVRALETWEQVFAYRLPGSVTVRRVRTFLGVDRGNVYEGHIIVQAEDFDLHRTSPHKEGLGTYDAYTQSDGLRYRTGAAGGWLYVHALCRATTPAPIACHVGLVVELGPSER